MKRLTVNQVIQMHSLLISQTGGLDGVRDEGLLEMAVLSPYQAFDGQYMYPTIQAKAAQLGFSLVKNHPFSDGNKRIGVLAMLVFLELNGLAVDTSDNDLIALGLGLADGSIDKETLLRWIFNHS